METVSIANNQKKYEYELPNIGEKVNGKTMLHMQEEISIENYYYVMCEDEQVLKLIEAEENNSELENKIVFLCSNHSFAKKIREKDYLVCPKTTVLKKEGEETYTVGYTCDKLPFEGITLFHLFQKENMERYHVDSIILYEIAIRLAKILKDLAMDDIYPGLLNLESIVVPKDALTSDLRLLHIERFQYLRYEQTFPWYPCDERLFDEEIALFDELTQWRANEKLLYKVLVAAQGENIKVPPRQTWEYSTIFWNILPSKWKERFSSIATDEKIAYSDIIRDLTYTLSEEKKYEMTEASEHSEREEEKKEERKKDEARTMFVLLRSEEEKEYLPNMSKQLYLCMEQLEEEPYKRKMAFVYGNKYIYGKPFSYYRDGFRVQLQSHIKNYSFGEAIIIAAELMEQELTKERQQREKKEESQLESLEEATKIKSDVYIFVDGKIRKDAIFLYAVQKLQHIVKRYPIQLHVVPVGACEGEAYGMLKKLERESVA